MCDIHAAYMQFCDKEGWNALPSAQLGKILLKLFPEAKPKVKRLGEKKTLMRYYVDIKLHKNESDIESISNMSNLLNYTPPHSFLISKELNCLQLGVFSSAVTNGNRLLINLKFESESYSMSIRGKEVKLCTIGFSNNFKPCKENLNKIVKAASNTIVCHGVLYKEGDTPQDCVKENTANFGDENSCKEYIRCISKCQQVVPWTSITTACRACQKAVCVLPKVNSEATPTPSLISESQVSEELQNADTTDTDLSGNGSSVCPLEESTVEDLLEIIAQAFPNAPKEMQVLLQSQQSALQVKDRRGIRWDPEVIRTCLNMWVRSPRSYEDLKDSKMLILPSGRQLRKYKNALKQRPGIQKEMLRWMKTTADHANVPDQGRTGILMHDECKIQQDLVLERHGDSFRLIGWVEMGEEAFLMENLKSGQIKRDLATDVLQITFLGHTGFRFPIAHFASKCAKAHELYIILWDVISSLGEWGFTVDGILQDGGQQNREFMNMLFPGGDALEKECCVVNVTDPRRKLVVAQDFSHCVKKIRNSILSSGMDGDRHYTRHLTYGDCTIEWKQWIAAVKWDRDTNPRPIHRRVTDSHLFPNPAEKMRNSLAEDMLNGEMLRLMQAYQGSMGGGARLEKSVELLQCTSALIKIFRDNRPILSNSDERLEKLKSILSWFQGWERNVEENIPQNKRGKCLPSAQCLQDLKFMIIPFCQLCLMRLDAFPEWGIIPSRFNSDLIENHFCQQRGLHNGNITHPNLATYSNTVNSIVLGQTSKSRGRKANASMPKALPYTQCLTTVPKKPKLLRM